MSKQWWKSKTVWFNALTIGSAILASVVSQDILTEYQLKIVIIIQSIANIGLRFVTDKPLKRIEK